MTTAVQHRSAAIGDVPQRLRLNGAHHTARPTSKLAETVHFYRDFKGLPVCHAISARGWGPADHPDFLHFFFDSGRDSTIAFFYYLNTDRPADPVATDNWLYKSVHTAWRVDTEEQLLAWRQRFESQGVEVLQVRHEILESIYATDPNGYMVEITWQTRELAAPDMIDAMLTLDAAMAVEAASGARATSIDDSGRAKARGVHAFIQTKD